MTESQRERSKRISEKKRTQRITDDGQTERVEEVTEVSRTEVKKTISEVSRAEKSEKVAEGSNQSDKSKKVEESTFFGRLVNPNVFFLGIFGSIFVKLAETIHQLDSSIFTVTSILVSLAGFISDEVYFRYFAPSNISIAVNDSQMMKYTFSINKNGSGGILLNESLSKRFIVFGLSFIAPQMTLLIVNVFHLKIQATINTLFNSNDMRRYIERVLSAFLIGFVFGLKLYTGFKSNFEGTDLWAVVTLFTIFAGMVITLAYSFTTPKDYPLWKILVRAIISVLCIDYLLLILPFSFNIITKVTPFFTIFTPESGEVKEKFERFFVEHSFHPYNVFMMHFSTPKKYIGMTKFYFECFRLLTFSSDLLNHTPEELMGAFRHKMIQRYSPYLIRLSVVLPTMFLIFVLLNYYFYSDRKNYTLKAVSEVLAKIIAITTYVYFALNLILQYLEYQNDINAAASKNYCAGLANFLLKNTVEMINNGHDFRSSGLAYQYFSLFKDHSPVYNRILRFSRECPGMIEVASN